MTLWLPPGAVQEQYEVRRQYEARLQSVLVAEAHLRSWNEELKLIDPYLELVRAQPDAAELKGGFYYVMRHNPSAPPSMFCVEGDHGEYREPDSRLFDELRSWDCWDDRVTRDRERRRERIRVAQERQKAREREERLDEAKILFKALESPSIRMGGSWTAKAGARRDR